MVSQYIKKNANRPAMVDIELNIALEGHIHTKLYIERLERVIAGMVDLEIPDAVSGDERKSLRAETKRSLLNRAAN